MSRLGGIRAGRAFVEIGGDAGPLERELKAASARLSRFGAQVGQIGKNFIAAGAAITAPLAAAVGVYAKIGDDLDKAAARTGVAAGALAELGFAANRSGSDLATVEKGIKGAQVSLRNAERGLSTATAAFDSLGLSAEKLRGLSSEQQFLAIGDALSRVEDESLRAALATELLGRAGIQLLPLFAGGASGIEALRKEASRLGSLTTKETQAAALLADALGDVVFAGKNLASVIGAALAPEVTAAANALASITGRAVGFIRENRTLVLTVAAVGAGLLAVGATVTVLGLTIAGVGLALGAIATAFGVVGAAAAAVASPIGIAIAAGAALGAMVVTQTEIGRQAIDFLRERFGALANGARQTFGDIAATISNGNIRQAATILGLDLVKLGASVGADLGGIAISTLTSIAQAIVGFADFIQRTIIEAFSGLSNSIGKLGGDVIAGLGELVGADLRQEARGVENFFRGGGKLANSGSNALSGLLEGASGFIGGVGAGAEASFVASATRTARTADELARSIATANRIEAAAKGASGGKFTLAGIDPFQAALESVRTSSAGVTDIGALRTISSSGPEERTAKSVKSIDDKFAQFLQAFNSSGPLRFV